MNLPACVSALLLLALIPSCSDDDARVAPPSSVTVERDVPCRVSLPGERLRCGVLEVAENDALPSSRRLRLPYVVLPARGSARPDPIVYLNGGPGSSGIGWLPIVAKQERARADRDIIVFEQRGNGAAEPALVCGDEEPRACHDRLSREGIDLSRYVTSLAARDVVALRRALGIERWNLFGISYGTTLALQVMKLDEAGIRSVVLDSPTSPTVDIAQADVESQLDGFTTLFTTCAADPACATAHPKARDRFLETVRSLDASPIELAPEVADRLGTPALSGSALVVLVARGLQAGPRLVASMPAILEAAGARDIDRLLELVGDNSVPLPEGFPPERATALGLTLSVYCAELAGKALGDRAITTKETWPEDIVRALTPDYAVTCAEGAWPVAPIDPRDREPVTSALPTLLLSGTFDPVTPIAQAKIAAAGLARATVVEVPGATHGTTEHSACAQEIMGSFLDAPGQADTSCLRAIAPLSFTTPDGR